MEESEKNGELDTGKHYERLPEDDFARCYRCFRPKSTCYCSYVREIDIPVKFVFLMHPKEAYKQRTGTGRLSALSLKNSEILVGINFENNSRLLELINSGEYYPMLLFPGKDAVPASGNELKSLTKGRIPLVIVIDSTWFFAKKILRLSPVLQTLPKLSFSESYRSKFQFKKQPAPECLSTIESCYYLIREFIDNGIIPSKNHEGLKINPEPLMEIFLRMVNTQLEKEEEREKAGIPNRYDSCYHRRKLRRQAARQETTYTARQETTCTARLETT